jgi:hypothetical protein
MDTSKEYIEMCKQAEEIQILHREIAHQNTMKWKRGDFWTDLLHRKVFVVPDYYDAWSDEPEYLHHPSECVWLPRQDQLQEMVGGFDAGWVDWFHWRNTVYPHMQNPFSKEWRFTSYEQCWLAFVMKENYKKVWNGKEWVINLH